MTSGQSSMIYAVNGKGELLWYQHTGAGDGSDQWLTTLEPSGCVGTGWNFTQVFADGAGAIYTIDADGYLRWFRHDGFVKGIIDWTNMPADGKGYIGEGWNMKHVFCGGDGVIYAIDQQNQLLWYRHLGHLDGTDRWQTSPEPKGFIGEGWDMKHVFSARNGVIYAVNQQNQLLWYRHLGFADGTDHWQTTPDPKGHIGVGWDMKHVFSGGGGVIYAVSQNDQLLWYKHLGAADGTDRWLTTPDPKGYVGEGWGFSHVFVGGFAPRNIGLRMEFQETSQWCWIAVGVSIQRYYNPASKVTQCAEMTSIGHRINGYPPDTNAYPGEASLASVPNLREALANPTLKMALTILDSPEPLIDARYDKSGGVGDALGLNWFNKSGQASISLAQLTTEIEAGRPVAFQIKFTASGDTHYIAVAGVMADLLLVCDPGSGDSVIRYGDFLTSYQGGASILDVALTTPAVIVEPGHIHLN